MKKVFLAQHPTEAHLIAGFLESHGIPSRVKGEPLFSARGIAQMTPDTLPSVWVLDDMHVDEALELLRGRPAAPGGCWTCGRCGQTVEPQFTACWQCGQQR